MSLVWEFDSSQKMLELLIGESFAMDSEQFLDLKIKKREIGIQITEWLQLNKNHRVLEIGSGLGLMSSAVAERVQQLHCCDISDSFIKAAELECRGHFNIDFHRIESGKLDFLAEASMDAAYSHNVFIHLTLFDIAMYLRELSRVVKKGGRVWFDVQFAESFDQGVPEHFEQMVGEYSTDKNLYFGLIQYNSRVAILALAKKYGFLLAPDQVHESSLLLVRN